MDARDAELKKELAATIRARKDLGEEYESVLVDSFLEKVDQRLDSHVERAVRRETAERRTAAARPGGMGVAPGLAGRFLPVVSLVVAIPLSAIAVTNAGFMGLLVTWIGVVGVNVANSSGLLFGGPGHGSREGKAGDWG